MDQISKALDKAKSEHTSSLRQWVTPGQSHHQSNLSLTSGFTGLRTVMPDFATMAENHMLTQPKVESPILADHYRMLRTRVVQKMAANRWNKLGITSAAAKAGKSYTAINLATTIARSTTHDVVLLDCDIRNPSIARGLGIASDCGLMDLLCGSAGLEEALVELESQPNLKILPGRIDPSVENRFELLSNGMGGVLQQIDHASPEATIIVDLPPVLVGDEVLGIAPFLDAFLMIVRDGDTQIESLNRSIDLMQGFEILGAVLNDSEDSLNHYAGYAYGAQPFEPK